MKSTMQRITVRIPTVLLHRACAITGEGITSTVRQGLRLITAVDAQKKLRELRGKVPISVEPEETREDRDLDRIVSPTGRPERAGRNKSNIDPVARAKRE